jgi:arabinogalactan endo-1,4-beta-galactosidase
VLSRRRMLSVMSLLATSLAAAGCGGSGPAGRAATTRTPLELRGADLSFTLQEETSGATFNDRGRTAPVERLLADRGANVVRLRVWVDATAGHSDLASALVLARRAREAGMQVLLDLHYSDTWADKASQHTPASWASQDLPALAETVRSYTRQCLQAFAAQDTPIDLIQIGNEITSGMLWPAGQIYRDGREHWADFVTLLQAGLQGAREGGPGALRTVLHIDRGGDNGGARYFYDHVLDAGADFDIVAVSYYPFWHGPLAALQANLDDLARRYGKDVLVVETSYPWIIPNGDTTEYFAGRAEQLPEADRFPPSPAGQAAYFEALRAMLQQVPDQHGLGFLAWEPAWLPGTGWNDGDTNPYGNLTMFDWQGGGLPSLQAFRP